MSGKYIPAALREVSIVYDSYHCIDDDLDAWSQRLGLVKASSLVIVISSSMAYVVLMGAQSMPLARGMVVRIAH
jgi:hypothetical protein